MEEIKEKKCFKCNNILPISEFYEHKKMPDGHLNKCKNCTKKDVKLRENELKNDPEWIEKERERNREKYYRLQYKGKYYPNREKKKETIKKYRQKFPEKYMASRYTELFLTKVPGYHLHHWSYNQEDWLDVIQLSISEHNTLHRNIKYNQETMKYENKDGELLDTKEKHLKYLELILNKKYGN
jgi:hypothetical protein